ncbi:hypothetical protein CDD82_4259 [Ophiocordyceps australis]|uniref:Uncharacterized protein n=1 Tax=Ophiocordyceps australis TaxID=1399860 RepID=A0A2C5ZSH3_9HYPO|nr:hypothetical protein CDD82_4259 [Ophiocordyceps australis]
MGLPLAQYQSSAEAKEAGISTTAEQRARVLAMRRVREEVERDPSGTAFCPYSPYAGILIQQPPVPGRDAAHDWAACVPCVRRAERMRQWCEADGKLQREAARQRARDLGLNWHNLSYRLNCDNGPTTLEQIDEEERLFEDMAHLLRLEVARAERAAAA